MAGKISKTLKSDGDVIGPISATGSAVALFDGVTGKLIKNSSVTETQLDTLTDNSIANTLHRHSELVASDGSPDPALSISSGGRVGVGTTSPGAFLDVSVSTSSRIAKFVQLAAWSGSNYALDVTGYSLLGGLRVNGAGGVRCFYLASGQLGFGVGDTSPITFTQSVTSEKMRIHTNGNVGIGTAAPATSALLDLTSTTGALLLTRMTTAQKNALTAVNGMVLYDSTLGKVQKREGGAWVGDGGLAGTDKQVQFNDEGVFGANAGLYYDKTKQKLTVGEHWDAGYPFDSYQPALEGISQNGEWGVLGASRSSDDPIGNSMRCLGLYGYVYNDSDTSAYGLYIEARKMVNTPDNSTAGAEIVILNRYNYQCDVTPYINYPQPTYGLSITSGTTYDGITDYPASCALYVDYVGSSFRRGIVISSAALMDHGSGKYIAMIMGSGARIAWHSDDNCIMGTTTTINTLIANNIITEHAATKFKVNQNIELPNNKYLKGLTTGSVSKLLIGVNASNAVEIATGVIGLVTIGYNGTLSDGVMIRVNGANKIIHTGAVDSGGTGYRALIVDN